MSVPPSLRAAFAAAVVILAAACSSDRTGPHVPGPAAHIVVDSGDSTRAIAGSVVAHPLVVRVTDANNVAVPAASVEFVVTEGNGSVSSTSVETDAEGRAQTMLTLGTMAGINRVTASATGIVAVARFTIIGTAGPAAALSVLTPLVRLHAGVDTGRVRAAVTDQYGNGTATGATWTERDPTLLAVDSTGFVRVLRRGGATYVVATAAQHTDSAYVVVLAPGDSPCMDVTAAASLDVGQVDTSFASGYVCIHAQTAGAEYALVPYYAASVPASQMQIEVAADGLGAIAASPSRIPIAASRNLTATAAARLVPDDGFEAMLRGRERALTPRVAAARRWYGASRPAQPALTGKTPYGAAMFDAIPAAVTVGDMLTLNASITDCSNPANRIGRVAAITNKAIVVADTGNPAGGFTDADYASIGTTFDTLVDPLDEQAFGAPTDIDGNGRVVLFFTRAVNALTPKGSSSVVLGFFYARDLLPRTGTGACPTSNQGEMFYLMVPDSAGVVNGLHFSKSFVMTNTIATTAHEFQHLINASRRYTNPAAAPNEETWLNEGLSHIAEELLFYRVAGLRPRQNVDSTALADPAVLQAYRNYHRNNALRYSLYLEDTKSYAPQGADFYDDALQTRGAIWSFLRYAADRRASTDGDFWFRLVNSTTTGMTNLTQVLGTDPAPWMRDWAISNLTDDWVAGIAPAYTQPSWNARSYFAKVGVYFPLAAQQLPVLSDTSQRTLVLRGGGVAFLRFAVASGQDALVTVTANGQPLPAAMRLAVVRVK